LRELRYYCDPFEGFGMPATLVTKQLVKFMKNILEEHESYGS